MFMGNGIADHGWSGNEEMNWCGDVAVPGKAGGLGARLLALGTGSCFRNL